MARLDLAFTSRFKRDYKAMAKHKDVKPLHAVFELIARNDLASREELQRRHNMHRLSGKWSGSCECHVWTPGGYTLRLSENVTRVWSALGRRRRLQPKVRKP